MWLQIIHINAFNILSLKLILAYRIVLHGYVLHYIYIYTHIWGINVAGRSYKAKVLCPYILAQDWKKSWSSQTSIWLCASAICCHTCPDLYQMIRLKLGFLTITSYFTESLGMPFWDLMLTAIRSSAHDAGLWDTIRKLLQCWQVLILYRIRLTLIWSLVFLDRLKKVSGTNLYWSGI